MAKIYANNVTRAVYYAMGEKDGQKLFRRAPFDVVLQDGKLFIQPRSVQGCGDQALVQLGRDHAEDQANWRDSDLGGYEILEPIILNENQVGDGSDNWIGLHLIGNI